MSLHPAPHPCPISEYVVCLRSPSAARVHPHSVRFVFIDVFVLRRGAAKWEGGRGAKVCGPTRRRTTTCCALLRRCRCRWCCKLLSLPVGVLVCRCVGALFECERVRECFRFVFCLSFTTREDAGARPGQGRSWHGILAGGRGSHLVSLIAVAVAVHLTLHRSRSLVQKFNLVYTFYTYNSESEQ